jgi:hypothetical protein
MAGLNQAGGPARLLVKSIVRQMTDLEKARGKSRKNQCENTETQRGTAPELAAEALAAETRTH